jgi:hypothetical protein
MGDDDTRASLHQVIECFLHEPLSLRIEGTRGFIEYEYLGIGKDRSGDSDTLLLSS